jgi:glycosyltransferase involved in cell wall biosynthesis
MKGFSEFFVLANLLPKDYIIILVGLKPSQFRFLPANVIGLERTENVETLVKLYNIADVHVSLSVEETFGLTIIESLACGTPVVAYNVAALKETVTSSVGTLVPLHNVQSVSDAVQHIIGLGKERFTDSCRKYVLSNYSDEKVMGEYIVLANRLLK